MTNTLLIRTKDEASFKKWREAINRDDCSFSMLSLEWKIINIRFSPIYEVDAEVMLSEGDITLD